MVQSYREDCNEAKLAREGIVEQRPIRQKSKKDKPIVVEYRIQTKNTPGWLLSFRNDKWHKWHSYRNREEAQTAIDNQIRKHSGLWEFRIKEDSGN